MIPDSFNPAGCIGRTLTLVGMAWVAIALFGGAGVLAELGLGSVAVAIVGGSILPGLFLIAIGRAVSRRGRRVVISRPESVPSPRPVPPRPTPTTPLPPSPPRPAPSPPPAPVEEAAARPAEGSSPPEEGTVDDEGPSVVTPPPAPLRPSRPKSSQELVDEARRRWGSKPD